MKRAIIQLVLAITGLALTTPRMIAGVNNKMPYQLVSLPNIKTPVQLSCHAGAGRHPSSLELQSQKKLWIPACAGMTSGRIDFQSTYYNPLALNPMGIQFFSAALR